MTIGKKSILGILLTAAKPDDEQIVLQKSIAERTWAVAVVSSDGTVQKRATDPTLEGAIRKLGLIRGNSGE